MKLSIATKYSSVAFALLIGSELVGCGSDSSTPISPGGGAGGTQAGTSGVGGGKSGSGGAGTSGSGTGGGVSGSSGAGGVAGASGGAGGNAGDSGASGSGGDSGASGAGGASGSAGDAGMSGGGAGGSAGDNSAGTAGSAGTGGTAGGGGSAGDTSAGAGGTAGASGSAGDSSAGTAGSAGTGGTAGGGGSAGDTSAGAGGTSAGAGGTAGASGSAGDSSAGTSGSGAGGSAGASGSAGTGGDGAGGSSAGASGAGAGGTSGSAGSGGTGGAPAVVGSAVLTVPFVTAAATTSTSFQIGFGRDVDMSAVGETATFKLCAQSATPGATVSFALQNGQATSFSGNFTGTTVLSTISACPTMQSFPVTVAGEALVTNAVESVTITIGAPTVAADSTTVVYLDSIKFTDNAAGPFDFAFNSHPLQVNTFTGLVAGSTLGFIGSGGDNTVGAPGVAQASVPFTATAQGQLFNYQFGGDVDLSTLPALTVNYNMCVPASTAAPASYQYQPYVTNNNGNGHYGGFSPFSSLSTCPTMTAVPFALAGGNLDLTTVHNIGFQIQSLGAGPFGTATLEIDSITVTPTAGGTVGINPVGPADFAYNTDLLFMNGTGVAGSTVSFLAAP